MKHAARDPDWLDDPSAAPDAEQQRLERALAPLRYDSAQRALPRDELEAADATPPHGAMPSDAMPSDAALGDAALGDAMPHDAAQRDAVGRGSATRGVAGRTVTGSNIAWRLVAAAVLAAVAWWLWRGGAELRVTSTAASAALLAQVPSGSPFELLATTGGAGYVPNAAAHGIDGAASHGGRIVCGADASARVRIGPIGSVELGADSTLRLERGGDDGYEVYLERGALTATIFAAPRVFTVGTPAGLAVDLGCIYRTEVAADGATRLSVVSGRVSFESNGRRSLVPAGAACAALPDLGPSAPVWNECASVLRELALRFDAHAAGAARDELLRAGIAAAAPRDSLTLIHLLERAAPSERAPLVDALERLAGRPAELARERLLDGDAQALALWHAALESTW